MREELIEQNVSRLANFRYPLDLGGDIVRFWIIFFKFNIWI